MTVLVGNIADQIQGLPDLQKMLLIDRLLVQLDRPDPIIDEAWAKESRRRWKAFKSGRAEAVSYAAVMSKYRRP